MKNRNINLGYILVRLTKAFFRYAPWLLFLYQYIDIREATILQLIGMITRVIAEIPTGALSDLFGKKKTLLIAFLLCAIGELSMAFSTTFFQFIIVYVFIGLGQSFYSGTIDAFIYDSLLEKNEERSYPKVLGKSNAYLNISTAIATICGGFLFQIWVGLPVLLTGIFKVIGMFVVFFVTEPKVDSVVFSTRNFIKQTALGFKNLFSQHLIKNTILLLILGCFSTVSYEILDDVAVVDWGYSAIGISFLFTTVILISIPAGLLYERISKKIKLDYLVIIGIVFLISNYIFSTYINVIIWTLLFLIRVVFSPIKNAAVMDILNQNTNSTIRATTISTYELLRRLPFAILGAPIGSIMKYYGVKNFSVWFSLSLLFLLLIYLVFDKRKYSAINVILLKKSKT